MNTAVQKIMTDEAVQSATTGTGAINATKMTGTAEMTAVTGTTIDPAGVNGYAVRISSTTRPAGNCRAVFL